MIDAILFDKDGTLLDFNKTWGRWAEGFLNQISGGDDALTDRLAGAIGYLRATQTFRPDSAVIAGTPDEGVKLVLPHLPQWTYDSLLAFSNETARNAPLVETVPLASYLDGFRAGGVKLGVATNDSEATARAHMTRLGVAGRFDRILGSDSGFGGKPGPGMCLAFSETVAVPPSRVVMVGDSTHDLHAGRAAGMICVAVLTGIADRAELSPHADVVLEDIGALPGWIASL